MTTDVQFPMQWSDLPHSAVAESWTCPKNKALTEPRWLLDLDQNHVMLNHAKNWNLSLWHQQNKSEVRENLWPPNDPIHSSNQNLLWFRPILFLSQFLFWILLGSRPERMTQLADINTEIKNTSFNFIYTESLCCLNVTRCGSPNVNRFKHQNQLFQFKHICVTVSFNSLKQINVIK